MPIFIFDTGSQVHLASLDIANSIVKLGVQHGLVGRSFHLQINIGRVGGKVLASPGELTYMEISVSLERIQQAIFMKPYLSSFLETHPDPAPSRSLLRMVDDSKRSGRALPWAWHSWMICGNPCCDIEIRTFLFKVEVECRVYDNATNSACRYHAETDDVLTVQTVNEWKRKKINQTAYRWSVCWFHCPLPLWHRYRVDLFGHLNMCRV